MRLKDKNGKPSTTLTLVVLGLVMLIYLALTNDSETDLQAFGTAWMLILGPWIAREVKEAVYSDT